MDIPVINTADNMMENSPYLSNHESKKATDNRTWSNVLPHY